jgi:hypothetical protein
MAGMPKFSDWKYPTPPDIMLIDSKLQRQSENTSIITTAENVPRTYDKFTFESWLNIFGIEVSQTSDILYSTR